MTKEIRGLCLIINLEKFHDSSKDRAGSGVDAKNLEMLTTELGFKVKTLTSYCQNFNIFLFVPSRQLFVTI